MTLLFALYSSFLRVLTQAATAGRRPYKKQCVNVSLSVILLALATPSYAHFPFCECALDAGKIQCKAGFSDGSGASGVTVDLISYDEEIIQQNQFSEASTAEFAPYDGEFYILLDAGPGHTVEVDWHDIQGLNR